MSMPSQSSEEGDRQQNRVKGDDRRARWTMKYFFGLMKEARTPFEVANVAFDERRYQVSPHTWQRFMWPGGMWQA